MSVKSSKVQVDKRVNEILAWRLQGKEMHDILQYAAEQGWNVGERQILNYMHAADALLVERLEKDRDKLFARHVTQRRALFAAAMKEGDLANARGVLKDEAELLGLYPAEKKQVNLGGSVILEIVEEIVDAPPDFEEGEPEVDAAKSSQGCSADTASVSVPQE